MWLPLGPKLSGLCRLDVLPLAYASESGPPEAGVDDSTSLVAQ